MSAKPAPWVRIIIVNYNAKSWLQATVDSLALQSFGDFEAVIVDNASTDGSAAALRLPDRRFSLVPAGANIGFAAGCNLGALGAATPWLAMLNPDAVAQPGWLEAMHAAAQRHADAAAFGSMQLMEGAPGRLDGAGDNYSIFGIAWRGGFGAVLPAPDGDYEVFSPCAAAALYRREPFEALGGFCERFFCYLEDVDLGFRLRLGGQRIVQVGAARVVHAGSAIAGRSSPFTIFHSTRNGLFMLLRCMPLALLALALPLYLAAQLWLATRTACPQARLKGLAAGLAGLLDADLLSARRRIQSERRLPLARLARLLVWNPMKLSRRDIVVLPQSPSVDVQRFAPTARET